MRTIKFRIVIHNNTYAVQTKGLFKWNYKKTEWYFIKAISTYATEEECIERVKEDVVYVKTQFLQYPTLRYMDL
jgi:hypothetical protein